MLISSCPVLHILVKSLFPIISSKMLLFSNGFWTVTFTAATAISFNNPRALPPDTLSSSITSLSYNGNIVPYVFQSYSYLYFSGWIILSLFTRTLFRCMSFLHKSGHYFLQEKHVHINLLYVSVFFLIV